MWCCVGHDARDVGIKVACPLTTVAMSWIKATRGMLQLLDANRLCGVKMVVWR
jgi:hypothetical protein